MGDQADIGARRKREIRYGLISIILCITLCHFVIILPISKAEGIEGSVSYLWEERKRGDERKGQFTQIYDLILSRRLQPLYDARLKFEFRSETMEKERDRERTQLLPSLNMRLGNEMTNLNLGWSKDVITDTVANGDEERDYTNERVYMGFDWRPKWLPHILCQFQGQKREEAWEEEPLERDDRISVIEEYTISFGPLTLDHSFDHERREINEKVATIYDLLNKGQIRHRFSFFKDRLDMSTGYELSQDREKEEDGDHSETWRHNANFTISGYPAEWMRPVYRAFWEDIKTDFPYKRENTLGHDMSLLFIPHPYFSSTLGMNYNRSDRTLDLGPREVITYSIKMEPQIKGLILDPDTTMNPVMTSILISSSTDRKMGSRENQTLSFLFTGSTIIYQGVDIDLDLTHIRRKNFINNVKTLEERVDGYLNLDLLPNLKGSINQKAKWIRRRGNIAGDDLGRDFEGEIETRLIYRPVETFMLDAEYTIDYGGGDSSYQYSLGWRPASKVEVDMRYQSSKEERGSYFLVELNLYMTHTIHLGLRYQYPPDDQLMEAEFTLRF